MRRRSGSEDEQTRRIGALFESHRGTLQKYFRKRLGKNASHDEAESLSQEVFMRLLKYRHRLAAVPNLLKYAFTVARNLLIEETGGARTQHAPAAPCEVSIDEEMTDPDSGLQPDVADEIAIEQEVESALARLSQEKRVFFELRNTGFTLREAAKGAGMTYDQGRRCTTQARQRLKALLPKDTQGRERK